jgi:hypothetical protein
MSEIWKQVARLGRMPAFHWYFFFCKNHMLIAGMLIIRRVFAQTKKDLYFTTPNAAIAAVKSTQAEIVRIKRASCSMVLLTNILESSIMQAQTAR